MRRRPSRENPRGRRDENVSEVHDLSAFFSRRGPRRIPQGTPPAEPLLETTDLITEFIALNRRAAEGQLSEAERQRWVDLRQKLQEAQRTPVPFPPPRLVGR